MATLCLKTSLETLLPLCCRSTHRLQRDVCCCLLKRPLQAVQLVVMLSASHVLQNIPNVYSQED